MVLFVACRSNGIESFTGSSIISLNGSVTSEKNLFESNSSGLANKQETSDEAALNPLVRLNFLKLTSSLTNDTTKPRSCLLGVGMKDIIIDSLLIVSCNH